MAPRHRIRDTICRDRIDPSVDQRDTFHSSTRWQRLLIYGGECGITSDDSHDQSTFPSQTASKGRWLDGLGVVIWDGSTGDAEADIVADAAEHRYDVIAIGAGRPICPACAGAIAGSGGSPAAPLRGP